MTFQAPTFSLVHEWSVSAQPDDPSRGVERRERSHVGRPIHRFVLDERTAASGIDGGSVE
jgi:hypothetical protein